MRNKTNFGIDLVESRQTRKGKVEGLLFHKEVVLVPIACISFGLLPNETRAMSGPTSIQIDGGTMGPLELSGGVDGLFYGLSGTKASNYVDGVLSPETNNAGKEAFGAEAGSLMIELRKTTGLLHFTVQVGSINPLYLGYAPKSTSIQSFSTGPLYGAYFTIDPLNNPVSISFGQMTGLEGFESTLDWNNSNILSTQLSFVESGQSRGVSINYTKGPIYGSVLFGDGYDTSVFNFLQFLGAYTINSTNTFSVYYGGNLGKTGLSANTYGSADLPYAESHVGGAPEFANSQMIGAYYSYTLGNLNLVPEIQYQYAKPQVSLAIRRGMDNIGAAVFGDYSFGNSPYSIGGWLEYFDQHESSIDARDGLFWYYGPNASGEGISITPTWQYRNLFLRANVGGLFLNRTSAYGLLKYGYGDERNVSFQFTGFLEGGLLL